MTPTIKDVAKKANVSVATVSLVIHNHTRISPETRRKVQRAIRDLNYHPTRSARRLVSQTSGNIGFICTDDHFSRSEPFYTQIFLGTEFQAREHEYYILLTTIPSDFNRKDKMPQFVLEKNVDGIIIAGKVPEIFIDRMEAYKMPLVFIDYYFDRKTDPVVLIDNMDGGRQAVEHLVQSGHRNIAFIAGDIQHPSIQERFQGYKMALDTAGIEFRERLTVTDRQYPDRKNGYAAVKLLYERQTSFTAVFTCNDAMAIGVLQYLKEKNIAVPKDISIIGFDDVEADLALDPPLTTIRVPKIDMGIESVRLMMEILQNKSRLSRKILVPVELVIRKSTCATSR
ncbi:MAG: LacI family DNA-binding transcriptional regulator [Calditrichia bacterium]